jgi:hypothetical protein
MAYINQPADLRSLFNDLSNRITKLENATRFTAPNVNITTNEPDNPRVGDMYYDLEDEVLVYWNGTDWYKLTQSVY